MSTNRPDPRKIGGVHIDHGFWIIPRDEAEKLSAPYPLPRIGRFRVVSLDDHRCELHQTRHDGQWHFAIMI